LPHMSQSLYPTFHYRDAHAVIEWLERTLGSERVQVYEDDAGGVAHAEIRVFGGIVMLGTSRDEGETVTPPGAGSLYVAVPDADGAFARARDAGVDVLREPFDTDYGSRDFTLRDPEGNTWHFGTYAPQ
jgi:uncharacterized glyoxalase superfamily protein PhnB